MSKNLIGAALLSAGLSLASASPINFDVPKAQLDTCAKPVWPREGLRNGYEGTVTLAFLVNTEGQVIQSRVEKSSGYPLLDLAAQEGLEKCHFSPATEDGKPTAAWSKMQYAWTLEDDTPEELAAALKRARQGVARHEPQAEYELGTIYLNGRGVARNAAEGRKWLRLAANHQQKQAQQELGFLALPKDANGDTTESMNWFRKAAKQGMPKSQYFLSVLLKNQGKTKEADSWLRKAAEHGDSSAQTELALTLMLYDPAPDIAQAVALLEKAAAQEDREAQFRLAECYQTGHGVEQDLAQAAKLYNKAAVAGHRQAQLSLAYLYENGLGVPKDDAKARDLRTEQ